MLLTFTLLVGSFGLILYFLKTYFGKNENYWKKRGVRVLKNDLTFRDLVTAKKSPPDLDKENYHLLGDDKYGGIVEFGSPMLLVKDLELIKQIMVKDFDHFVDRRPFIDSDPLFSKSLFFLHTQDWKDMRNFLSPTFTSGKIKRMFHHFKNSGEKLFEYIQAQHPKTPDGGYDVNVPDVMGRYTSDVIGAVAFGMETDCLSAKDSYFFHMARRATDFTLKRMVKFGLFTFFTSFCNYFNMQGNDKDVADFFTGILKQALKNRKSTGEKRDDFLQLILEAKDEKGEGLSEDLIIPQAFLFFMAGFDTIANLLGESAYLLALNPEIQDKLYAEVEEYMQDGNGEISYEAANKMEYLEMFISEMLRMYAPVERLERRCIKKWTIPGTNIEIPEGTMIGIPAAAIHHDEKFYPDPETVDPERFNQQNKADRNPYTYLPFGTGPRNCIGMRLALIEAKVALAMIVYNFKMQPTETKTPIPVKLDKPFGFTRLPKELEVRMVPRNH